MLAHRGSAGRCQNGGQLLELLEELGYVDASDAILDALREPGRNCQHKVDTCICMYI